MKPGWCSSKSSTSFRRRWITSPRRSRKGDKVELRNFGVFEVKVRKARVGRNPNARKPTCPSPQRAVVKFKAGKEMRADVFKLSPAKPEASPPRGLQQLSAGFQPARQSPAPACLFEADGFCHCDAIAFHFCLSRLSVLTSASSMERLPGFRDFYPEPLPHTDVWSADARQYIFATWRETARRYGFREYDGPPLEPLELYTTKSGEEIVGQLYNFVDKGERAVALRPEMTPTLARMVAAHERNYKKPIKWFAIPQLFRYERQQKGRLREHFQFNADIIGETDPAADAELIALLIDSLRALGLTAEDFVVRLSSRNAWQEFFHRARATTDTEGVRVLPGDRQAGARARRRRATRSWRRWASRSTR